MKPSLALILLAGAAMASAQTYTGMCSAAPAKINLGGDTIEERTAASEQECCNACMATPDYKCMGWNYCSAETCGDHKRGACHLKRWSSSVNAPAWGCSGDWQPWRSGLASPTLRYDTTPPPCADPNSNKPESGVAPGVPTSVRQNWGGQLVILDVDSWKMGEGGNHGSPSVKTAYDCALQCNGRVGRAGANGVTANAFSFCDKHDGCGANCDDYSRGKAPTDGSKDELYFGPWAQPCAPGGRFRHKMCSCKAVGGNPVPLADDSTEWISGYTVPRN